jgi:hypothetical protein
MGMKFNRHDRPYSEYETWRAICPEGAWKKVAPQLFQGLLPKALLAKTNSVFVMASGSPQSSVFVANLNRVDEPASAVDQEPYVVAFDHSTSAASGGFIHHGDWLDRTTEPGDVFFGAIAASGIQAHYPLSTMPRAGSGLIENLQVHSQSEAWWASVSALGGEKEEA